MNRKIFSFLFSLLLPGLLVIPGRTLAPATVSPGRAKVVVYKSNFNSLTAGLTQPFPGHRVRMDGLVN